MFLLLSLLLWLVFGASAPEVHQARLAAAPLLTQADSGKTVRVGRPDGATLRLSHRWRWSEPRLEGRSVRLQRVDYIRDPGFDEWQIEPVRKGTTTITAIGVPGKRFRLTVRVG